MAPIHVKTLYDDNKKTLKLELLAGKTGLKNKISQAEIHRPGLALSGFVDIFSYERIQVLGNTEVAYLDSLSERERAVAINRLVEFDIPCIVITNKNKAFPELLQLCDERGIPVFRTPHSTTHFYRILSSYLEEKFAPSISMHASLVDVYGIGVLLTGRSGIGKSEVALDLVERGHRLVADDVVNIIKKGDELLIGMSDELIQYNIEIRGLGIVDIRSMFGIRAVRKQKRVEVEVHLEDWNRDENYERIGLDNSYTNILGVKIPQVRLPIFPGKNITVIVETIALNTLLKIYGVDSAKEFNRRLLKRISFQKRLREYLEHDME